MELNGFRIHDRQARLENNGESIPGVLATICRDFEDLPIAARCQDRCLCHNGYKFSLFLPENDGPDASVILEEEFCGDGLVQEGDVSPQRLPPDGVHNTLTCSIRLKNRSVGGGLTKIHCVATKGPLAHLSFLIPTEMHTMIFQPNNLAPRGRHDLLDHILVCTTV